jgi:hypothetical protein
MKKILFIFLLIPLGVLAQNGTKKKITADSLPAIIHDELHKQYATYSVNSIYKSTDELQNTIYKIEVQKKSKLVELVYDNQGKLISKEKSKIYSFDGTEKPKAAPSQSNDGHSGHQH